MAVRRRAAAGEPVEGDGGDSGNFAGVGRVQQGPEAAGVHVCRLDGDLCAYAGGGDGERSLVGLLPVSRGRAARMSRWERWPTAEFRSTPALLPMAGWR